MHSLTSWVQTDTRQQNNPFQQTREMMVAQGGDGGYASFYWNQVPNPPSSGLLGALQGAVVPAWVQWLGLVAGAVAVGGAAYGITRHVVKRRGTSSSSVSGPKRLGQRTAPADRQLYRRHAARLRAEGIDPNSMERQAVIEAYDPDPSDPSLKRRGR